MCDPEITTVFTTTLPITTISLDDRVIHLNEPLLLTIDVLDNNGPLYLAYNDTIDACKSSRSLVRAVDEMIDEYKRAWERYVECDICTLDNPDAVWFRKRLEEMEK